MILCEEDLDKFIKIIKGIKDTVNNAILNLSSNSNGIINGVPNPDVDNSEIERAIQILIDHTNLTIDDIFDFGEAVGSLELGVSILTAGGVIGGVVIQPGLDLATIQNLQNEENNNNNSNNNSNNNDDTNNNNNNNNNSNNDLNNNNNNSNNDLNNNNNSSNNNSNNNNDINNNSSNDNFNNNDGPFSANSIIEEGDSVDFIMNFLDFNLFISVCIFLLLILLIYYINKKSNIIV